MNQKASYQIKIEVYDGPFDLLIKAIDDGQIDIFKVSLSQIVDSYFSYWKREEPNLLVAADFILMAAYLIELKARELLPFRGGDEAGEEIAGIEQSLVDHIQEYEVYKKLAHTLRERKQLFEKIYGRHEGEKQEKQIELVDVSLKDLLLAFQKVYNEAAQRERVTSIPEEEITLDLRLAEIRQLLANAQDGLPFISLFLRRTRIEIVVTFLAILELAKQTAISIKQGGTFGEIYIFPRKEEEKGENPDGSAPA
jgi:segregation and condensation protein A